MKKVFTVFILLNFTTAFSSVPCDKCDIEKVNTVIDHLDNLTFQIISDFLCTFDSSCHKNVEYSEWSNETLFKVLEKSSVIYFKVIAAGQIDNTLLLKEIESPIHDFDLQKIYDNIKATNISTNIKEQYLKAVLVAAEKDRQKIKK